MPPHQSELQSHKIDFGASDVQELFNGAEGEHDTFEHWWGSLKESPPTSMMDPVSSEILTRGKPVEGQGNITVGLVGLETAPRAMYVKGWNEDLPNGFANGHNWNWPAV